METMVGWEWSGDRVDGMQIERVWGRQKQRRQGEDKVMEMR